MSAMALVCFDTNFAIWAIRQDATSGQEQYMKYAQYVVQQCEENGDDILLPSVVLGEMLGGLPEEMHQGFARSVEQQLSVVPYDVRAAVMFARMWKKRRSNTEFSRSEAKPDYMIAAIAVTASCKCIYSNDKGLRFFAEEFIPVITTDDIVLPPAQLALYSDENE